MSRPSAPASAALSAIRIECAVSFEPAPATIVARAPTASTTARTRSDFSGACVVGDSPVVPLITSPSCPWSTRYSARRTAAAKSTAPSSVIGVTIAVSTAPNGRTGVTDDGMAPNLPCAAGGWLPYRLRRDPTVQLERRVGQRHQLDPEGLHLLRDHLDLALREDSRFPSFPQREIEMVAEKMEAFWIELMPLTHAAFELNGRVAP